MGFESSNTSTENIKENQFSPDIIDIISQLQISPEQIKKLEGLPPESRLPIIAQLENHSKIMEQIPNNTRTQYMQLFTQKTSLT